MPSFTVIWRRLCTASTLQASSTLHALMMFVFCSVLYGLKQAPRAWYQRFAAHLRLLGFVASVSDTSLFVLKERDATAYLLLYVDDIILTASSSDLLQRIMARLHSEFTMTDLDDLHHFLGISVTRSPGGPVPFPVPVRCGSTLAGGHSRVSLHLDSS